MTSLYHRILSAFRVGSVNSSRDDGPVQLLQVKLSALETRDNVVNPCMWGIKSRPHPGAQLLISIPAGSAPGGVVIASGDQRYTFSLAEGEVVLYDDLGQSIHLTRTGITVNGGGLPIKITNTPTVRAETPLFECTGDIQDNCDTQVQTMATMRSIYDGHTHNITNVQAGASTKTTAVPNQLE